MDDRDALPSIGRFTKLIGLTVRALRLYDRQGVLIPTALGLVNGYRYYAEAQVDDGRCKRISVEHGR